MCRNPVVLLLQQNEFRYIPAILAAYDENAPFMADESVLGVPGIGVVKYDLLCYTRFAEAVQEKTAQLKEIGICQFVIQGFYIVLKSLKK